MCIKHTGDGFKRSWEAWWFAPVNSLPLGVFRIALGLTSFLTLAFLWPYRRTFFSDYGLFSTSFFDAHQASDMPNLLRFAGGGQVDAVFAAGIVAAFALIVGQWSRLASFVVWAVITTLQARNPIIFCGGDTLLRQLLLLLMVAPSGSALSVDRWLRDLPSSCAVSAWPLRLVQLQMAAVYFQAVLVKLGGQAWQNGQALYIVLHLADFRRFPYPAFVRSPCVSCLLTWAVLGVEVALFSLVWTRRRPQVALAGLMLHAGIWWCMNVPLFSEAVGSGLLCWFTGREYLRAACLVRSLLWKGKNYVFAAFQSLSARRVLRLVDVPAVSDAVF